MLKRLVSITVFILITLLFFSCITSKKLNYMQPPSFKIPAYTDIALYEDYHLKVGDRLYIRIYSTDQETNNLLNGPMASNSLNNSSSSNNNYSSSEGTMADLFTYLIKDDGAIKFPMVGDVQVGGKTLREATIVMEEAIDSMYMFCDVEMRIVNRTFSIISTNKSAYLTLPMEKINIFEALAMVGDVEIYGDRSKIKVLRETESGVEVKMFDLRSADIIHSEYYYIEPNDVIYIQEINERFFSVTNVSSFISTIFSTISFGFFMYDIVK